MSYSNIVIVGAGGTASFVAPVVAKLMAFRKPGECTLTIIDEDEIEDKNLARSYSEDDVGMNKAELLAEICVDRVPSGSLDVKAIPAYVLPSNFDRYHEAWCKDGVVVLACVDNNVSRCFIEEQISKLDNAVLITPGNDVIDGQVHTYIRRNGEDVSPKISEICPSMAADNSPNNIFPDDENCTDKYEEEPQLILANMTAGVLALNSLWRHVINDETRDSEVYNEVYFNVNTCAARPFERQPLTLIEETPATL